MGYNVVILLLYPEPFPLDVDSPTLEREMIPLEFFARNIIDNVWSDYG